ncbi:hypothetical protein [Mycobacteroides abscessus]|uniref:hypothetical protein n=1 Tax=Mycobacteroides abscessus TaxID=36809 RepID=UPI00266B6A62|nr:hypothetical protein [Mycobacteroides abscessus]MDO3331334.1 hypothetical protein [Mycobacteroides abscessus subsp. abscessus]
MARTSTAPTETDPIKLLQTQRLRSREELTSVHLHRIASLTTTTESDRTATPEHLSQDRPDAQPWREHAIPKYIGGFRSLVNYTWRRRTQIDLIDCSRESIIADIESDRVIDAVRSRDMLWQLAGQLAAAAYEFTNDFLEEPDSADQSNTDDAPRRRHLRLIAENDDSPNAP